MRTVRRDAPECLGTEIDTVYQVQGFYSSIVCAFDETPEGSAKGLPTVVYFTRFMSKNSVACHREVDIAVFIDII